MNLRKFCENLERFRDELKAIVKALDAEPVPVHTVAFMTEEEEQEALAGMQMLMAEREGSNVDE